MNHLAAILVGLLAAGSQPLIALLETGEFHGDEVDAKSGEQWLGLYRTQQGYVLRNSIIRVEAVHDVVVDDNENVRTGKKVTVRGPVEPVFLVRGPSGLRSGRVTVVQEETYLNLNTDLALPLHGQMYHLKVVSKLTASPHGGLPPDAQLVMTTAAGQQILYALEGQAEEASFLLRWSGDLDGDGRLDLYLSVGNYNLEEHRLFLSSHAGKGQLVKQVAAFVTTGC
jgi:hypothetical protein